MPIRDASKLIPYPEKTTGQPVKNLVGRTFERLTVIEIAGKTADGRIHWRCSCSCGNETIVSSACLIRNATRSCGCLRFHHQSSEPEYKVWDSMIRRCANPQAHAFASYGGRGITVCDRWLASYANFIADMGHRPSPKYALDRIDNNGPYAPGNCRWTTRVKQARNRRSNRLITYGEETLPMSEWAERYHLLPESLSHRLKLGWSIEKALTTPVR